jgi:hypothetical protein
MQEGCQGFAEPNLSTLLYKSRSPGTGDLNYGANVVVFLNFENEAIIVVFFRLKYGIGINFPPIKIIPTFAARKN